MGGKESCRSKRQRETWVRVTVRLLSLSCDKVPQVYKGVRTNPTFTVKMCSLFYTGDASTSH